jgi:hypothetical protein
MDSFFDFDSSYWDFHDLRKTKRFEKSIFLLESRPTASIPQACGTAANTKGLYRFLESDTIDAETIDEGTYKLTLSRIYGQDTILVPQDTSSLNFNSLKQTQGLGPIDAKKTRGMLNHTAFAVRTDGLPLGVIDHFLWTRDGKEFGKKHNRKNKLTAEKESQRWIDCEDRVVSRIDPSTHIVMILDREGDFFDYLAHPRSHRTDIIVRCSQNRRVSDVQNKNVFTSLEQCTPRGEYQVKVTNKEKDLARVATVQYGYCEMDILQPKTNPRAQKESVHVWGIMVWEKNPPEGVQGLNWKILTTIPITSDEDAMRIIEWYSYRWLIERYHYALKSGSSIEKLQLETADRLKIALAMYTIVAMRIVFMAYMARKEKDASAETILTEQEWKVLCCMKHKTRTPPKKPPTVLEAVMMIAELGGFLGRKGDGMPGMKVLWRGMMKLADYVEVYILFTDYQSNYDVGKA